MDIDSAAEAEAVELPMRVRPPSSVVTIGASSDGLASVERVVESVRAETTDAAFVVVHDLVPDAENLVDRLLRRHAGLRVRVATDDEVMEAGVVYLVPTGLDMTVSAGRLIISERDGSRTAALPMDVLLSTMVADFDEEVTHAVVRDEFTLHYQPIVDPRTARLHGFEALLRWASGAGRGESPARFVPVLERLGLMDHVGRTVFVEAIRQLGVWQRATGLPLSVHVNLSASQVIDEEFAQFLFDALAAHGVAPGSLVIEMTESMLFEHREAVQRSFELLRASGIRLSVDDFGTGYNSLLTLRQFRPDQIKIDGAFVNRVDDSPVDLAIVKAEAVLASSLGMSIVAECVETDRQLAALNEVESDIAQGYHFGRPMAPTEVERSFTPFPGTSGADPSPPSPEPSRLAGTRLRTSGAIRDVAARRADVLGDVGVAWAVDSAIRRRWTNETAAVVADGHAMHRPAAGEFAAE